MPTPVDIRITPSLHADTLKEVDGYDEELTAPIGAARSLLHRAKRLERSRTSEGEALEAREQERDEAQNPDAPEVQADAPADAVVTTGKPKKEPKPKVVCVEQNGVKRPASGGLCAAVWEYLDQHGNMMPKDLKPVAEAKGWNFNNAQIELYQWRKFMGLSKAAKAAVQ